MIKINSIPWTEKISNFKKKIKSTSENWLTFFFIWSIIAVQYEKRGA